MDTRWAERFSSDQKNNRDYIFVDDVCHITIKIMLEGYNGILNIGSGSGTDIKTICLKLLHITKKSKSLLEFNKEKKEGYSLYYDIGKLNSVLNSPYKFTSIEDGLIKTVKWHKKLIGENKNENFTK